MISSLRIEVVSPRSLIGKPALMRLCTASHVGCSKRLVEGVGGLWLCVHEEGVTFKQDVVAS
jgi:hypothetical protein